MLTLYKKQSALQAGHYFKKDMSYYTCDNFIIGDIVGEVAVALGLNGTHFTPQNYELHTMLFNGFFGSKQLIRKCSGDKSIAGLNITMEDPKEISILRIYCQVKSHLLGKKLYQAHENAIQKTLSFIERYVGYRKKIDGKSNYISNTKLIISRFRHETNQFDEPHTHTHLFIYNMTIDENGKWRAIDKYYLLKNRDLFHMIWYVNLAEELHRIGIETEIISREKGTFRIKNFDRCITEHFSQRTIGIEEAYKTEEILLKRVLSIEEKNVIKMKLQPKKSKLLLAHVYSDFIEEIEEIFGFSITAIDKLIIKPLDKLRHDQIMLKFLIDSAIDFLNTQGQMYFTYEDLLKSAFLQTHSKNYTLEIEIIENAIKNYPDLIYKDGLMSRKLYNLFASVHR
jgi:conjugative relaxase-like TrwC/TraI family protein